MYLHDSMEELNSLLSDDAISESKPIVILVQAPNASGTANDPNLISEFGLGDVIRQRNGRVSIFAYSLSPTRFVGCIEGKMWLGTKFREFMLLSEHADILYSCSLALGPNIGILNLAAHGCFNSSKSYIILSIVKLKLHARAYPVVEKSVNEINSIIQRTRSAVRDCVVLVWKVFWLGGLTTLK